MRGVLPILTFEDAILGPLYFLILLSIVILWKEKYYKNSPIGKYIIPLFLLKIASCVFLACLYHFYYGYSDSQLYFTGGREIYNATIANPKYGMELLFKPFNDCSAHAQQFAQYLDLDYGSVNTIAMYKVTGFLSLFCFGAYLPIAFLFTMAALIGSWRLFLVFYEEYPNSRKLIAISCLFAPSILLWGTNILKDPICLFALSLCFTALYKLIKRKFRFINLIEVIFGATILLTFKGYIFYLFIAAAIPALYLSYIKSITNGFLKIVFHTFIFITIIIAFLWINNNENLLSSLITNNFIEATRSIQLIQQTDETTTSSYIIPNVTDFSPLGIISSYLLSLNVALFRPYLWEIRNPLMILSALESFAVLLATAFLLFKTKVIGFFSFTYKNPVLFFALIYTLLLAALAGFVSFNFGTLSRYKLPCLPFYFTYLALLYDKTKKPKSFKHSVSSQKLAILN